MSTDATRQKRVDKAQVRVLLNTPFFGPGVAKLPVVFDDTVVFDGVPTACTNGKEIRWHPKAFDETEDKVLSTVLCHEVAHCLLGHIWRFPPGGDSNAWNLACDENVNQMLSEFGALETAKGRANPFPMPDGAVIAPPGTDESEEVRYAKRMQSQPPPQQPQGGKSGRLGGKGASGGQQPASGGGKSPISQNQGGNAPIGSFSPAQSGSPDKVLQNDWNATLIQAVEMAAKGRGDVPGSLRRFVSDLVNPKVPWFELLRNWLRERCADDWCWSRPDPHFDESGFVLPSLESEKMGEVVFAWDRSGSISQSIDAQFLSEAQSCLDDLQPSKLIVMPFDTHVRCVKEFRPGETIDSRSDGGGGTDFTNIFKTCDNLPQVPKCLVILTDGDGGLDNSLSVSYPVLWVLTENRTMPFGNHVYIDETRSRT